MGKKAQDIMSAMSLEKNPEYPDATPAVHMALAKARELCAESASTIAQQMGADEEGQELLASICLRNSAMITP